MVVFIAANFSILCKGHYQFGYVLMKLMRSSSAFSNEKNLIADNIVGGRRE